MTRNQGCTELAERLSGGQGRLAGGSTSTVQSLECSL